MTTKPRKPHRGTLDRYGHLIGDLSHGEDGAALFFPELREAEIKRKLAARAEGLRAQAALFQRYADDPRSLLMWIRRNDALVGELIAAANPENSKAGC